MSFLAINIGEDYLCRQEVSFTTTKQQIMNILNILALILLAIPTLILLVLSIGCESSLSSAAAHFFVTLFVQAAVAACMVLPLWYWPFKKKIPRSFFFFSCILFARLMPENIEISKELDRVSKSNKEMQQINSICFADEPPETYETWASKQYPIHEYGDSAHALEYLKKTAVYAHKETSRCAEILSTIKLNTLYNPETLFSAEQLKLYRTKLVKAYENLEKLQAQAINYHNNLFRIFRDSSWKHILLKDDFLKKFAAQTEAQLEYHHHLYQNYRTMLHVIDDIVVFLINRQGLFTLQGDQLNFDSDLDDVMYANFCADLEYVIEQEGKINEKLRQDLATKNS